jgi:ubiquinone/menaquinone biosynthesis C-methylase UbiE
VILLPSSVILGRLAFLVNQPYFEAMSDNLYDELARLVGGYWYTQTIYVAAKLGLAELLREGSMSVQELAEATGTSPKALYRLLRALASLGIFAEEQSRFVLTPLAECLLDPSTKAMAIMRGEFQYRAWGDLLHSIQTGKSAFEQVYGKPIFDYFSEHPETGKLFDQAMTGVHGRETEAMLEAYDFTGISTLADIGGGNGSVVMAILRRYPVMQGILFDLPAVVERSATSIQAAGLADRCQLIAGDFFEGLPAGADAYLLRHIIHDWDDASSLMILRHCRRVIQPGGKLLVVEGVVPRGNVPSVSKFFDLAMMVLPGGMERTEEEYRQLFEAAGFRLTRIVPTRTWVSVIEGKANG